MPEYPEVQALVERLGEAVAGAPLESFIVLQFSALKTFAIPPESLIGARLLRVGRRGKFVIFEMEGERRIALHLSQGGRIDLEDPPKKTRPRFGIVRLCFRDRPAVLVKEFGTERKAGWWVLGPGDDGPLAGLGLEARSNEFADHLRTSSDTRRIHTMLRHQGTVAGIGRGYSDDILHRARLSPYATLPNLTADERERLASAVQEVLDEGLAVERRRKGGLPNKVGDHWVVHGRAGTPCPACGDDLRRVSYDSHEVAYCPSCQTGGKILADRRMSRLIK